jgi:cytochrome bd-type quinol oxidase subunit 1
MAFYQGHSMTAFFLENMLLGNWLFGIEPID